MRLIDAGKLKETSEIQMANFNSIEGVRVWIDRQPTIEAVPVVHGEWETVPNKVVEHGEVECRGTAERCSNCFHASPDFKKYMSYCPNCGADMRKKVERE